jgi:hypothetical protein
MACPAYRIPGSPACGPWLQAYGHWLQAYGPWLRACSLAWLAGGAALAAAEPSGLEFPGGGGVVLSPTRVVLEGRARAAEVLLMNPGGTPVTYRIGLIHLAMDESGRTRECAAAEAGPSAQPLLRFAPRQVTLGPGETQSVRIQVRKPEGLADGEYRAHLRFQAVPRAVPARPDPEAAPERPEQLSVSIQAVYGVSIPVLVRHGRTQAGCILDGLRLDGPDRLRATLHLEGNRSVHGDLVATWHPRGGKPKPVGRAPGVAVYAGVPRRTLELRLEPRAKAPGTLRLAFQEQAGGKVLAQSDLDVE